MALPLREQRRIGRKHTKHIGGVVLVKFWDDFTIIDIEQHSGRLSNQWYRCYPTWRCGHSHCSQQNIHRNKATCRLAAIVGNLYFLHSASAMLSQVVNKVIHLHMLFGCRYVEVVIAHGCSVRSRPAHAHILKVPLTKLQIEQLVHNVVGHERVILNEPNGYHPKILQADEIKNQDFETIPYYRVISRS